MKQQTAVEWLEEELKTNLKKIILEGDADLIENIFEQAKEMEKEQHSRTWFDSTAQFDNSAEMTYKKDFKDYYNETFKKQ